MVHYGGSTQWKLFRNDRTLGGGFFLLLQPEVEYTKNYGKLLSKRCLLRFKWIGAFSTVVYPGSRGPFSKYLIWNIRAFSRRFIRRWSDFAVNDPRVRSVSIRKKCVEPRVTVVSICAEWWQSLFWFGFLVLLEVCLLFFTHSQLYKWYEGELPPFHFDGTSENLFSKGII